MTYQAATSWTPIRFTHTLAAFAVFAAFAAALPAQTTQPAQAPAQSSVPAAQWQTYSYSADGFSASFPSQPDLSRRNVPTAAGSFELRSYVAPEGQVALFVGVCDYGSVVAGKDPNAMLQGAKNGALENSNSHLVREDKITLGVYPGLAFEAESSENHFSARIYMVGTTLYQVVVVRPTAQPYEQTTRFLDSFQLIARTAAP